MWCLFIMKNFLSRLVEGHFANRRALGWVKGGTQLPKAVTRADWQKFLDFLP